MSHHRLLQVVIPNLAADTKVLLAGLLLNCPDGRFDSAQAHAQAKALGMSARIVRRSMLELISLCFVDAEKVRQGRGQPMAHYELTEHFLGLLREKEKKGKPPWIPKELIDAVLLADSPIGHLKGMQIQVKGRSGLQGRVSASNRLLLAVLLCHADRFGIVEKLGLARLSKLTGLTRTQVEAQLFKLNQFGLIRSKIPGFSGSTLLGSPKTVYFLNLHHPDLAKPHLGAVVLLVPGLLGEEERSEAAQIFDCAHDEHFTLDADEGVPLVISEGFDGLASALFLQRNLANEGRVLYAMLQHRLDGYASALLSKYWLNLSAGEFFLDKSLLEAINQDIQVKRMSAMAREAVGRGVSQFLYEVAFLLAVRIRRQLGVIIGVHVDALEFRLLPLPDPRKQSGSRAILVVSNDAFWSLDSLILYAADGRQGSCYEQTISLDYRYACGLLTHFPAYTRYTRPE